MGSISASYSYRPSYHYLTKPLSHSLPSALYLSSKPNSPTLSLSYPTGSGFNSIKLNYPKLHLGPPPPLSHNGNNNNGNNNNNDNNPGDGYDGYDGYSRFSWLLFLVCSVICCVSQFYLASCALAKVNGSDGDLWEVRGGNWVRVVEDIVKDEFVVVGVDGGEVLRDGLSGLAVRCRDVLSRLLLPEGFPESVTSDYWDYSVWRGVQGVASQVSGVLATQALLYAVGLGKGAIPTAAAINWVLKDGIGYLSKILLSKYGRHFDVHPKGWRLFADFLENAAFGLEIITPAFPNLFVLIGAVAGAGRSAAALIQAATRSCFYAGFAAQRNFAEVIAKGEAQGMVSKSIGIMLGIALANRIRSSTSLALAAFVLVTWVHMFCNLKSYQCIQLRTLNPYRASLVFSEYLLSGQAPSIKEVNDEEPLFPFVTFPSFSATNNAKNAELDVLSQEAKDAAAEIERRLLLGSKLSDIIHNRQDALALFELYKDERYILAEDMGRFCVVLQESASPQDMLKALFHVNYLYWIEKNAGIGADNPSNDCRLGGRLQLSLDYVQREFNIAKTDAEAVGWSTDGLIARPLPNRIQPLIKQKSM